MALEIEYDIEALKCLKEYCRFRLTVSKNINNLELMANDNRSLLVHAYFYQKFIQKSFN